MVTDTGSDALVVPRDGDGGTVKAVAKRSGDVAYVDIKSHRETRDLNLVSIKTMLGSW